MTNRSLPYQTWILNYGGIGSTTIFMGCVCLISHHAEQVWRFTSPAACCWALGFDQHGHLQRMTCTTHRCTLRAWQPMCTSELNGKYTYNSVFDYTTACRQTGVVDKNISPWRGWGALTCGRSFGEAVGLFSVQWLGPAPAGFSPWARLDQTLLLHQGLLLPLQIFLLY